MNEIRKGFNPAPVNAWLFSKYGKDICGQPRFRLVFSEDQFEKRLGTFSKYYGDIWLNDYTGVEECYKYWFEGAWVLERLVYYHNPEIMSPTNWHYEPLWVFTDRYNRYLEPHLWAVQKVMEAWEDREVRLYPSIGADAVAYNRNEEKHAKQVEKFKEILDPSECFYGKLSVKSGEAVSLSNKKLEGTEVGPKKVELVNG